MKEMFAYVRVSTTRQGLGASLEAQQESIRRFAAERSMSIVRWFEEKETAAKQGRPVFAQMMKMLKARKARGVIIHKIDRSTRNWKDWVDITNLLDSGCEVHFAHDSFDLNTRSGRLMADIMVSVAVDMIRNQKQETVKGQQGRLMQGLYPWRAPVGYLDQGKGRPKVPDPVMGPFVTKAFELYAGRAYTLKKLLERVTAMGLRSISGKPLSVNGLSTMLRNPFYVGTMRVNGTQYRGAHQALVSTATFEEVQAVLDGKTNQKAIKHDFSFRKLLRCGYCNYSLIGEVQKGNVYYRCHTKGCETKGFRERHIEALLLRRFRQAELTQEEALSIESTLAEAKEDWSASRARLEAAIKMRQRNAENKLERLTDCYLEGTLDKDAYEHRKGKLLIELRQCEEGSKDLDARKGTILRKINRFLELSKSLVLAYENGIPNEKRALLELVTSNFVAKGKNLVIAMKSPFEELANRAKNQQCDLTLDASRKMERSLSRCGNAPSPYPVAAAYRMLERSAEAEADKEMELGSLDDP